MDAKKCDRCGRFYEEYEAEFKIHHSYKIEFIDFEDEDDLDSYAFIREIPQKKHYDLCPLCMDELNKFLTDPNAFQCLGNCNECENRDDCEVLAENELMENYTKEKQMSKFKATTPDGKTVFGNLIRWELLGCWMVHDQGETLINPDTIEKLSDGE